MSGFPHLPPHTPLRRWASISLRLEQGFVVLHTRSGLRRLGEWTLRVLDYFGTPHTIEDALRDLQTTTSGALQGAQLHSAILALLKDGVLVIDSADDRVPHFTGGYAAPAIHVRMLNDTARTRAYLTGIAATVKPGDIVVDVGTGTGILALAAARAGAQHVYAIERSGIADAAEAMFRHNGFADRITVVRGWSTDVTLPQRADVMIAELVGIDPFDEQIAELTADAIKRLLSPRPRLVPYAMKVGAVPVAVPDARLAEVTFTEPTLRRWRRDYEFDFQSLSDVARATPTVIRSTAAEATTMQPMGDAVLLSDTDLTQPAPVSFTAGPIAVASQAGRIDGLLIFFDLDLSPGVTLTTRPGQSDATNHWGNVVILFPRPLTVAAGDRLRLTVSRTLGVMRADAEVV